MIIQQILLELLLFAKHLSRCWEKQNSGEQNGKSLLLVPE